MQDTTDQRPWAAQPACLTLGWVMTSDGLRMCWTLTPEPTPLEVEPKVRSISLAESVAA